MYRYATALVLLGGAASGLVPDAVAQSRDPNKITTEEIAERPEYKNAQELIRGLRPNWLRVRPTANVGSTDIDRFSSDKPEPAIYVDSHRMSTGVAELRNIRVGEIVEIRYLSGNAALARYGNGHEYGAIFLVTTRARPE